MAVILGMALASTPAQMPDALQAINWASCSISALRLTWDVACGRSPEYKTTNMYSGHPSRTMSDEYGLGMIAK